MILLLNKFELEMGIRTYIAEEYDVMLEHTWVDKYIFGDNVIQAVAGALHNEDYTLSEDEIREGIKMLLEQEYDIPYEDVKGITLLPIEALVDVDTYGVSGELVH